MKFEFDEDAEGVGSGDPYYDLILGGYIKPEDLLSDPDQISQVRDAIEIVQAFLDQAEESEKVIIC